MEAVGTIEIIAHAHAVHCVCCQCTKLRTPRETRLGVILLSIEVRECFQP